MQVVHFADQSNPKELARLHFFGYLNATRPYDLHGLPVTVPACMAALHACLGVWLAAPYGAVDVYAPLCFGPI
jgi:hypothetical protein